MLSEEQLSSIHKDLDDLIDTINQLKTIFNGVLYLYENAKYSDIVPVLEVMYAQSKTGINGLFRKYEALPDIPKMFYHDLVNTSFNITNAVYFFKDSILTYPIQVKRWCELTGKIINESLKKVEELKRRLSDYFPPNP